MKKMVNISLIFILLSSCTMTKIHKYTDSLEGQKWTWGERMVSGVAAWGNSWTFLPNNKFTATSWYSGGAYWTDNFSGTYYYDAESKTAFLKYDKNKNTAIKEIHKQQLNIKIIEKDTTIIVTNSWKKAKEVLPNFDQNSLKSSDFLLENSKFKIQNLKLSIS